MAKRHPGSASFDTLHALDYLEYAYLQIGDEDERATGPRGDGGTRAAFDEPSFAAGYAIAAVPARWALERRDWKGAAELRPPAAALPWDRFAYAPAITEFARALGAARSGRPDAARAPLAKLTEIQASLAKSPVPGPYDWAAQVESMRLAAAAWLAYARRAEGRGARAGALRRRARREGRQAPRDSGLRSCRRASFSATCCSRWAGPRRRSPAYEASLREAPGRFNSLYGAGRAAEAAGRREVAARMYGALLAQCVAGSPRVELARARKFTEGSTAALD